MYTQMLRTYTGFGQRGQRGMRGDECTAVKRASRDSSSQAANLPESSGFSIPVPTSGHRLVYSLILVSRITFFPVLTNEALRCCARVHVSQLPTNNYAASVPVVTILTYHPTCLSHTLSPSDKPGERTRKKIRAIFPFSSSFITAGETIVVHTKHRLPNTYTFTHSLSPFQVSLLPIYGLPALAASAGTHKKIFIAALRPQSTNFLAAALNETEK